MSQSQHPSQKERVIALSGILFICVVVAVLAGIIASVFTEESLRQYVESLTRRESIQRISQVQPRALPGTYEEALARVTKEASPSVALITSKTSDSVNPKNWLAQNVATVSGAVVTSDGWILVASASLATWKNPISEAEVWVGGKRYEIDQVIPDTITGLTLLKVTSANLPAIAFGDVAQMGNGQFVFALPHPSMVIPTSIVRTDASRASVMAAELYATGWMIQEDVGPSLLVNAAGEMVAMGGDAFEAVPMDHILPFIQSVLKQKMVAYAGLGVTVADITAVPNLSSEAKMGKTDGALVIGAVDRGSVFSKKSPAQAAGIKLYDVILAVNGVPVTHTSPLSVVLKEHAPGETVTVSVMRAGTQIEIDVTLGNFADLVYSF